MAALQSGPASLLFLSLSLLYGFPGWSGQSSSCLSQATNLPSYLRPGLSEVSPNIDLRLLKKLSLEFWFGW